MYRVTREFSFCYGHRLINYDGKCRHIHGHNGRVAVVLEGALDCRAMVVDFGDIKRTIQRWVDDTLDHNLILCQDDPLLPTLLSQGERVYVTQSNPTAEHIARLIHERAAEMGLPVVEVTLWETETCSASYRHPGATE